MTLNQWAIKWGVSYEALADLQVQMGMAPPSGTGAEPGRSESNVQSRVRLEAARKGLYLWRNNVGACVDEHGNHIRYGLANDSQKLNKVLKSSDLIGFRPVRITAAMVGQRLAQFVAREVKAEGWEFTGTEREEAQKRFLDLVLAGGGDAAFASEEGTL